MKLKSKTTKKRALGFFLVFFIVCTCFVAFRTKADPVGIGVISNTTNYGPSFSYSRNDEGGTITTLDVNVTQQTEAWKGYVGNITGQLALRDSSNYTIYDWQYSSITGEIFASRASSITWSNINCSDHSIVTSEYAAINMADSDLDSINKTFNNSVHPNITIAGLTILENTCNSSATYVNSTAQEITESAYFKEVLLDDDTNLIYATILEQNIHGYRTGFTYDFQMIIPDSDASATRTTYYFFAELG